MLKICDEIVAFSLLYVSLLHSLNSQDQANVNELKAVLKNVQPGDRIVLANGEWKDAKIIFEADGTKEKPITAQEGETQEGSFPYWIFHFKNSRRLSYRRWSHF
ncbi:MAG: hypothetical protein MZW92_25785 [Comamonadaceae bacterium]|nr:hypothetical protein [Comamonadaceae bacterium]